MSDPAPLLETRGLTVAFGGLKAVSEVTLGVCRGAVHGLIGPNGAGKSTLFNAISGFAPISSGNVVFAGAEITRKPPHARPGLGIQRTFQSVQLVRSMTVLENILVGLHPRVGWRLPGVGSRRPGAVEIAADTARELGLADRLHDEVELLSFRDQRYVEIARALVSRPALLLLDEPAAGLSGYEIDQLDALILRLTQEKGITVLLVEHVMSLVMKICDRITVLEAGRVIADGTPQQVSADPAVIKAYLGDDEDA